MTATSTLANYIVSAKLEDFPDEVVLQAKHLIQDATGCALGGAQPASMALAESTKASGKTLITAIALAHEIASRIGMSLGGHREEAGHPLRSYGFGCCIFGAAAGAGKILGFDAEKMGNAFGIAGNFAPLPGQVK